MDIEITVFGDEEGSRTATVAADGAGAGTINLVTLDEATGEGPAGMIGYFALPVSSWPQLRAQIDALTGSGASQ